MADSHDSIAGGLAGAAHALETELTRFEELTTALQRERLNSEKAIRRAAQRLTQVADCDTRLAQYVQTLVSAIGAARQRQEEQARTVQQYATTIQQRATVLADLHAQGEALNQRVTQVNGRAQQLLSGGNGHDETDKLRRAFAEIQQAVQELANQAQTLAESAQREDFIDIARNGDSLRTQLLATHNKLQLLERQLS